MQLTFEASDTALTPHGHHQGAHIEGGVPVILDGNAAREEDESLQTGFAEAKERLEQKPSDELMSRVSPSLDLSIVRIMSSDDCIGPTRSDQ